MLTLQYHHNMKDDLSHLKHALNRANFSLSKNRVSRDCQSSLVTLAYSYIKLQVWVLIESNTYDCCCHHSAGNTSQACLKGSNFSHSKNRVSRDCQSILVTLAYSYIKLQVWVLIEYNNWIATAITVLVSHHKHALKGSNFSHSKNRVSRD